MHELTKPGGTIYQYGVGEGMEKKWNERKNQAPFFLIQVNLYLPFKAQLRYPLLQEAFPDLPDWFGMILKYYHFVFHCLIVL